MKSNWNCIFLYHLIKTNFLNSIKNVSFLHERNNNGNDWVYFNLISFHFQSDLKMFGLNRRTVSSDFDTIFWYYNSFLLVQKKSWYTSNPSILFWHLLIYLKPILFLSTCRSQVFFFCYFLWHGLLQISTKAWLNCKKNWIIQLCLIGCCLSQASAWSLRFAVTFTFLPKQKFSI